MNFIVTGAVGFIGSHLTRKLVDLGHHVVGVDNLSVGFLSNVKGVDSSKFYFLENDVRNFEKQIPLFLRSGFMKIDGIFHLAARGETYWCQEHPEEAVDVNVNGTLSMLKVARELNCRYFVFADTSAEYDALLQTDSSKIWYPSEEHFAPNTATPRGIYSITKMAAAQFVRSYCTEDQRCYHIFRPFNVYGPSMNLNRDIPPVIGSFANNMLLGIAPTIFGNGTKRRDFIYIDDAISLFISALLHANASEFLFSHSCTCNMGTGTNYSIYDVYRMVADVLEFDEPPHFAENKDYEAEITLADTSFARREFEWSPKIEIEKGIRMTVEHFRDNWGKI